MHSGPVEGKTFDIGGYARVAGHHIRIEALTPADQDPFDPDSTWEEVTTVEVTGTNGPGLASGLFFWSTSLTIVPTANEHDRWTDGGLARIRAFEVEDNVPLTTFDDLACIGQSSADNLIELQNECASFDNYVITLVSDSVTPAPLHKFSPSEPRFFSIRQNPEYQGADYYETIDAPDTFQDFKQRNGFNPLQADNDVTARYFNDADLGFGREMHCREVLACDPGEACSILPPGDPICDVVVRTACYVTNYGGFGDSQLESLQKIGTFQKGETVAMEKLHYEPDELEDCEVSLGAGPPESDDVRFFVYHTAFGPPGGDPLGSLLTEVTLDQNNGPQAIPGLCLNCHGGNGEASGLGDYNVTGAKFLPFDVESFGFSASAGITQSAQEEAFRKLNAMVLDADLAGQVAGPLSPLSELIAGWYGDEGALTPTSALAVHTQGTEFTDFVPPLWRDGDHDERLYEKVVAPNCRLCHVAFTDTLSSFGGWLPTLSTPGSFRGYSSALVDRVCKTYDMPHSRRTFENLWGSDARAVLVNEMDYPFDCRPPTCSNHGVYNPATEVCDCDEGFEGLTCQISS